MVVDVMEKPYLCIELEQKSRLDNTGSTHMDRRTYHYTLTLNRSRRTYTIRRYDNGKLTAKYRTFPQGREYTEEWTQGDIIAFMRYSQDYYEVHK